MSGPLLSGILALHHAAPVEAGQLGRAVRLLAPGPALPALLPAAMAEFLRQGGTLETFPRAPLLGFGEDELGAFMAEYEQLLVPLLLLHSPTEHCLVGIGRQLGRTGHKILEKNINQLATFVLPGLACQQYNLEIQDKENIIALADFIATKLGGKESSGKMFESFCKRFGDIVLQIFLNVNHPAELKKAFGLTKVLKFPSDPPELSVGVPGRAVGLLGEEVWVEVGRNKPHHLVRLAVGLSKAGRDPLRSLHSLHLWLECLGPALPHLQHLNPFLATFLTRSLLSLVSPGQPQLAQACITVLDQLVRLLVPVNSSSLCPILPAINYGVVSLLLQPDCSDVSARLGRGLLQFLVLQHGDQFPAELAKLEDFPAGADWAELQEGLASYRPPDFSSLARRVERFLALSRATEPALLAGPLQSLQAGLAGAHSQLSLLEPGQLRGLVTALLRLADPDTGVAVTALDCLAELGPLDMGSPVLEQPGPPAPPSPAGAVMVELWQLLLSPDRETAGEATSAITGIISLTVEGAAWLAEEEDPQLASLLAPFARPGCPTPRPGRPVVVDQALERLDRANLWRGEDSAGEEWPRPLVTAILMSCCQDSLWGRLRGVASLSTPLCRALLPRLVCVLLAAGRDVRLVVSVRINAVLASHWEGQVGQHYESFK